MANQLGMGGTSGVGGKSTTISSNISHASPAKYDVSVVVLSGDNRTDTWMSPTTSNGFCCLPTGRCFLLASAFFLLPSS